MLKQSKDKLTKEFIYQTGAKLGGEEINAPLKHASMEMLSI
jgi:hypothetical protein